MLTLPPGNGEKAGTCRLRGIRTRSFPVQSEYLTPAEAGELLRLTEAQVFELTRARTQATHKNPLPVIYVGKHVRFSRTALTAWLNAGGSRGGQS